MCRARSLIVEDIYNAVSARQRYPDRRLPWEAAGTYLDALPEGWAISRVSALELIVGARDNRDLTVIDAFLSAFVVVPLRKSAGTLA
jgi:predicted nucleic acid-binding protein